MGICHSSHAVTAQSGALPAGTSVIFILGGPGSGKGTQCERITAEYDCAHISAGDLLREEVQRGTELGKECDALMKEGKLVPVETTLALLQSAMLKSDKKTFLIDGFPRAIDQATKFDSEIQPCSAVLFFECSEEVMTKRLLERGLTSGRADDNEETIRKRLKTFQEMSAPVAQFYETQGKCYRVSTEEAPDVVFKEVQKALETYLKKNKSETAPVELTQTKPSNSVDAAVTEKPAGHTQEETAAAAVEETVVSDVVEESAATSAPEETVVVTATEDTTIPKKASYQEESKVEAVASRRIVFVLGGPGSGKGTQCARIVETFGYRHISVGDLLRAEVASQSELGKECDALMKEGKLVPDETTLALLKKAIATESAGCCLIDGFPRSIEQAKLFEQEVAICDSVLYFDCSEAVMLERMTERAKDSGRADDNPETMQKRLETFTAISAPVVQFYSDNGKCHSIPAERQPSEVFADVQKVFESFKSTDESDVKTGTEEEENVEAQQQEEWSKTVLVLLDGESKTAMALSTSLTQKGWRTICQQPGDDLDIASRNIKAILWDPSSIEKDSEPEWMNQLEQASEKGIVLLPSLNTHRAWMDETIAQQIAGDAGESGDTAHVHLVFETPIDVVIPADETEKSETTETHLKPDDPEVAALIQQLIQNDLQQIKNMTADTTPPLWSATYNIVQEAEDTTAYKLSGLGCLPLDLTDRLEYTDLVVAQVDSILSGAEQSC